VKLARAFFVIFLALWYAGAALADPANVRVAVAANFANPMKVLANQFEKETGNKVLQSVGATAKLYAQIRSGAPFDIFLAADEATPERLDRENAIASGSRFTYATGRLVLWSALADGVDAKGDVLKNGSFRHLAIAAPKLAPYGAAALQTLNQLGLDARLKSKLVQGESIGQTYSFVASGNAELGFVALSQVYVNGQIQRGSGWVVPGNLHTPLRQDAVLLAHASDNPAAKAFLAFLKTNDAKTVIRSFGYAID
jgi:molybdate transport system substrate-binding protein